MTVHQFSSTLKRQRMKPGLSYALAVAIMVLAIVLLVQHRKLNAERSVNASLRGDSRARVTAHHVEMAEMQKELQKMRTENDQLRRELQSLRERRPTRGGE